MKKDLIFFAENGITDTEANRIADFAKLAYTNDESYLDNISFIDKSIETINGDVTKPISFGVKSLSGIDEKLQHIGELKSLCAWLREAVAAHQRLLIELKAYSFNNYIVDNNIKYNCPSPIMEEVITEDDVLASFDIKKRNRYYYLEAQAATIGQFIHKNGSIDRARKDYYTRLQNPRETGGSGLDMLIYTYTPSLDENEIENTFYELQQKHADYQRELNSIKSEIKSKVTNDTIEKTKNFDIEYKKYIAEDSVYRTQYSTWLAEEKKRIASLKIVIPNSLKKIFDEIYMAGKKK